MHILIADNLLLILIAINLHWVVVFQIYGNKCIKQNATQQENRNLILKLLHQREKWKYYLTNLLKEKKKKRWEILSLKIFSELRLKVEVGLCDVEKAEVRFQTYLLLSRTTWLRRQRREKSTLDTRISTMIIWAFLSQSCEDFYITIIRISSIIVTRVSDNNCHSYALDENCLHKLCFSEKRTPWAKNDACNLASGNNSTDWTIFKMSSKESIRVCLLQAKKLTNLTLSIRTQSMLAGRQHIVSKIASKCDIFPWMRSSSDVKWW